MKKYLTVTVWTDTALWFSILEGVIIYSQLFSFLLKNITMIMVWFLQRSVPKIFFVTLQQQNIQIKLYFDIRTSFGANIVLLAI